MIRKVIVVWEDGHVVLLGDGENTQRTYRLDVIDIDRALAILEGKKRTITTTDSCALAADALKQAADGVKGV